MSVRSGSSLTAPDGGLAPSASAIDWHVGCVRRAMPKAKRTRVKGTHKDFAAKNTMNPPGGGGNQGDPHATQQQDPKRRIGQFGGEGEPPLMNK